jgi:hydrogenase maturation factor
VNGLDPSACGSDHCITCGDDGVPMTVLAQSHDGLADCAGDDGATSTVEVSLVAPVAPGARVLVHAGVAIAALDGAAA